MAESVVENRPRGLLLRALATLAFSCMSVPVKLASEAGVNLPELMLWRQALALPVVLGWIAFGPGLGSIRTSRLPLHARRAALGLLAMTCSFGALALLPLAEATILSFTVPIFATILAALILNEQVGLNRWAAVIIGFGGVLVMLQPTQVAFPLMGAAVGLCGALFISMASLQIRDLGRTEAPTTTVFWFTALSVPVLALTLPFAYTPHSGYVWMLLLGIGTLGGIAQMLMTASLRHAPVSVVVIADYSGLIWAALFGWLVWEVLPAPATWIGAPIIVGSGLYIAWREHRLHIARTLEIAG